MELILILGIFVALVFNFMNGLHDAANSIATIVGTRVLSPLKAVSLAAFCNLIGPLFFTTAIAKTIGQGIIIPTSITVSVIIAGISIAIIWVLFTAWVGIPISSTHAMIGGLIGSAVAFGGFEVLVLPTPEMVEGLIISVLAGVVIGVLTGVTVAFLLHLPDYKEYVQMGGIFGGILIVPVVIILHLVPISGLLAIAVFIVVSPMLGFTAAYLICLLVTRLFSSKDQPRMNKHFRHLQILSAAFYSIGHGSNDAQHAMGIITAMLFAAGLLTDFTIPVWVIFLSCAAMSLGTLMGGWKIVETMAKKITKLRPYQGFCAETGGGVVLSFVTMLGVPVSSTHAINGAITGVGAINGYSAVQWGMVRRIVTAWIITIPLTAISSYAVVAFIELFLPK